MKFLSKKIRRFIFLLAITIGSYGFFSTIYAPAVPDKPAVASGIALEDIVLTQAEVEEIIASQELYAYFGPFVSSLARDLPAIKNGTKFQLINNLDAICERIAQGKTTAQVKVLDGALQEAAEAMTIENSLLPAEKIEKLAGRLEDYYKKFETGSFDLLVQDNIMDPLRPSTSAQGERVGTRRIHDRTSKTFRNVDVVRNLSTRYLAVGRNAVITGDLVVGGNETINKNLQILGNVSIAGSINSSSGSATINGALNLTGSPEQACIIFSNASLNEKARICSSPVAGVKGVSVSVDGGVTQNVTVNNAGGVVIAAPASGSPLQLSGLPAGAVTDKFLTIDGSGNVTQSAGSLGTALVNGGQPGPVMVGTTDNTQTNLITNSSTRLNIDSAGAVTINTPDAGTGLTVDGGATLNGVVRLPAFMSTGVVHNNASGELSTSLIVNADVAAGAGITDNKLATIATAGKVANSATTAQSALGANTIVLRDGSNNFSAGTITANLTGNVTGAASLNVLKAGDTMTGALNMLTQNEVRFQDAAGGQYVGLNAPTAIPASYTLSLPSTIPTVRQIIQANSVTPTNLEWVTPGSSVLPASSRTIIVAKYGNDLTGDGTWTAPYASLAKAVTVANGISTLSNPVTIFMATGVYTEDNSAGPIAVTAAGISIIGDSATSVIIIPGTLTQDLISTTINVRFTELTLSANAPLPASTKAALSFTGAGNTSNGNNLRILNFNTGIRCAGAGSTYLLNGVVFTGNGTAFDISNVTISCNFITIQGSATVTPANTGVSAMGASANVLFTSSLCQNCVTGFSLNTSAKVVARASGFRNNTNGIVQTSSSQLQLNGCTFQINPSSGISVAAVDAGTLTEIIGCYFNGADLSNTPQGTAVKITGSAVANISGGQIENYITGIQIGTAGDTISTGLTATSLGILNCITNDIIQAGTATLSLNGCTASGSKISINDSTNVTVAFFDIETNNVLNIGKFSNIDTPLIHASIGVLDDPRLEYKPAVYSTQAIGFEPSDTNPGTLFSLSGDNAHITAITTDRTKTTGVRLVSDTATPVGGITQLRGWDISKNATTAELAFKYQNSDTVGQPAIAAYTVMQLDGVNNRVQLPTAATQLVFAADTNLYRSAADTLKTDDNLIIGGLAASRAVATNGSSQLVASATTATELGYVSGVTGPIQTQFAGKVAIAGDTMTGTLLMPVGTTALPSLAVGAVGVGLSSAAGGLSLSTSGAEALAIDSSGAVYIDAFTTAGVVHNDAVTGKLTSSLIVNADITPTTIANNKLATASVANVFGNIVIRDGSTGYINVQQVNLGQAPTLNTDAATKAYVDAAVSSGIVAKTPAVVVSVAPVADPTTLGLIAIDGYTLQENDRVLLVAQVSLPQNGLWVAHAIGGWLRPTDFDTGQTAGEAYVLITGGTTYVGSSWLCNTPAAIIGNTSPTGDIEFVEFTLPSQTTAANQGSGTGQIFINKVGQTLNLRTIAADTYLTVATDAPLHTNEILISTNATSGLGVNTLVARDGSNNFSAGTITASLTGAASLNVLKTGDTMTGTLTISPATNQLILGLAPNTTTISSLVPTGAKTATIPALAASDSFVFEAQNQILTNKTIDAAVGINTITNIADASIAAGANIADTKLATIATALKVSNSATTATDANTPSAIVARDLNGDFSAGTITATLNGSATGDLPLTGGTLTGTLQLPAGTAALPSLRFTGATTTGLSVPTVPGGVLTFSTNALERMTISSSGTVSIKDAAGGFATAGVVHNNSSGNLSSALVDDSDVKTVAGLYLGITDSKLATISTAGKVANSATTATSANTPDTIVLRAPVTGNFSAGTITAATGLVATTGGADITGTTTINTTGAANTTIGNATNGATIGGVLLVAAGTPAIPGIKFSGSTNTGFSAQTPNVLEVSTQGISRAQFGTDGGLTISAPTANVVGLTVTGNTTGSNAAVSITQGNNAASGNGLAVTGTTANIATLVNVTGAASAADLVTVTGAAGAGSTGRGLFIDKAGAASSGVGLQVTGNVLAPAALFTGQSTTTAPALRLAGVPTGTSSDVFLTLDGSGNVTRSASSLAGVIVNGGQAGALTIGSTNNSLSFITNNLSRIGITTAGAVSINAPTSGVGLTVTGNSGSTAASITAGTGQTALAITGAGATAVSITGVSGQNALATTAGTVNIGAPTTGVALTVAGSATAATNAMAINQDNASTTGNGLLITGAATPTGAPLAIVAGAAQNSITTSLGTVTLPAYSFTGDTNTGIYSPGADQVALTTAGTQRALIDATGSWTNFSKYKMHAYRSTTQAVNTTTATLIFDTVVFDSNSNYNNATGVYTAPVTGIYSVNTSATALVTGGAPRQITLALLVAGSPVTGYSNQTTLGTNNANFNISLPAYISLSAGQTLAVQATTTGTTNVAANLTFLGIHYMSF